MIKILSEKLQTMSVSFEDALKQHEAEINALGKLISSCICNGTIISLVEIAEQRETPKPVVEQPTGNMRTKRNGK